MVDCFVPLFHPLAQEEHYSSKPDGATFQERMENLLSLTTTTGKDEVNEPILKFFYDFGEKWLLHGAPIHVKMVPKDKLGLYVELCRSWLPTLPSYYSPSSRLRTALIPPSHSPLSHLRTAPHPTFAQPLIPQGTIKTYSNYYCLSLGTAKVIWPI